MASPDYASDQAIALAQMVKARTAEIRLKYTLMADAEVKREISKLKAEFAQLGQIEGLEVLDFQSEARRLLDAGS